MKRIISPILILTLITSSLSVGVTWGADFDVIKNCVRLSNGEARLVPSNTKSCKSGERLISVALPPSVGLLFVELIIDQENKASVAVAEKIARDRVDEWELHKSGQGKMNSGKFYKYHAYENIFLCEAKKEGLTPLQLLDLFWIMWEQGIDLRQLLPYQRRVEKKKHSD